MIFSFSHSLRFALLCGVSVFVAGCQSAPPTATATAEPVPLTKVEQVEVPMEEAAPSIADVTLETRVSALEGKMAQDVEPRLKKIDVIENHFQALSLELKTIAATSAVATAEAEKITAPAATHSPKAETIKPAPKPVAKQKITEKTAPVAAKAGGVTVKTLRFGAQKNGKVRIVLDATSAAAMNYDLDNTEGILLIDLPKAGWKAGEPKVPTSASLLKNAHVKTDESGSHLIIELAGKAKVLATGRLTPSGSYGHRVYLDVAPTP